MTKRLYDKVARLARQHKKASAELDKRIQEVFGFSYSQVDSDEIIDTLDYGISDMGYEEFKRLMSMYKAEIESGERDLNA